MRMNEPNSMAKSTKLRIAFALTVLASCITIYVFISGRDHLIETDSRSVPRNSLQYRAESDSDRERSYWISLADVDKHFRELQLGKRRVFKFANREMICNWILRIGETDESAVSQYYHAAPFTTRGGSRGWHVFPYGAAMRMTDGIKWMEYPDMDYLQANKKVYHEVIWSDGSLRISDPVAQAKAEINGEVYQPEPFAVVWKGH